jgi:hypothetical protein
MLSNDVIKSIFFIMISETVILQQMMMIGWLVG